LALTCLFIRYLQQQKNTFFFKERVKERKKERMKERGKKI
jgi:hypothetical protein